VLVLVDFGKLLTLGEALGHGRATMLPTITSAFTHVLAILTTVSILAT
jgi:hypothetical protein